MAQKAEGAMELTEFVPLSIRTLVAVKSLLAYLGKMLLPLHLVPYYRYPKEVSLFSPEYIFVSVFVLGISVACLTMIKKQKLWPAVWAYYLLTLAPVLGIVQVGHQSMADRYTYLPSIGPFLIAGLTVMWISTRASFAIKLALVLGTMLLCIQLSYLTFEQTRIWQNGLTLWNYIIAKEPDHASAYYYRGIMLEKAGQFDKAAQDYDTAIQLNPFHYGAYNNRGILYGKSGRLEEALESFSRSIKINPDDPNAYCNQGYTYFLIGRYDEALEHLNRAIELDKNYAKAYFNRGNLYLSTGNKMFAVSDFQKACYLGDKEGCYFLKLYGA